MSHQFYVNSLEEVKRTDSEIVTVGNIDSISSKLIEKFDYAALGHIHTPMNIGYDHLQYSGSPMAYSLSEACQQKGMNVVTLDEDAVKIEKVLVKPLHEVRKLKGLLEDVLKNPSDDYVSITLTDTDDLDVFNLQEQLRKAFPNLLEIHRQDVRFTNEEFLDEVDVEAITPFEMFCKFFEDITKEEKDILIEVINTVKEGI
ncbi:Exonuclease SbcD [Lachnospiraceae bacterium TWA4]|nr:Exonuclease SbcD [Lachnospiraceae bacterium TWA4]